jgi:hypothetical protein
MNALFAAFWYESLASLGPFWSAWLAGYAVVGADGQVYLTDAGAAYLAGRG